MNDLQIIGGWVKDPKRKFSDGLAMREKYKINNRMDDFFARANPDKPSSTEINMLLQEITKICIKLRNNPRLIEAKAEQLMAPKKLIDVTPLKPIRQGKVKIESSTIKEDDLPDSLKPTFLRIKEIMPLLSANHANLKAAKSDAVAKQLSEEIVALDAEKKAHWAHIDKYYKSRSVTLVINSDVQEEVVKTPLEKIMEIQNIEERMLAIKKREKVVVDDIAKAQEKLEEFKKSKPHMVKDKEASIAKKEKELKALKDARAASKGNK